MTTKNTNTDLLTSFLFTLTSIMYFGTAGYSHFYKNEDGVFSNIGLGIVFLGLAFVFNQSYNNKK